MNLHVSILGLLGGSVSNESACKAGNLHPIPGSGRSPGEGNGNPFQYSCLENSMDRGAWRAIQSGLGQVSISTDMYWLPLKVNLTTIKEYLVSVGSTLT